MPVGPRILGHNPAILEEQREQLVNKIEESGPGIVGIRSQREPALPILPDL